MRVSRCQLAGVFNDHEAFPCWKLAEQRIEEACLIIALMNGKPHLWITAADKLFEK
jgi:hypothetical protein